MTRVKHPGLWAMTVYPDVDGGWVCHDLTTEAVYQGETPQEALRQAGRAIQRQWRSVVKPVHKAREDVW